MPDAMATFRLSRAASTNASNCVLSPISASATSAVETRNASKANGLAPPRRRYARTRPLSGGRVFHLRLQVVLQAHFVDELDLRFEPIDVIFGVVEDFFERLARDVVARLFATRDGTFYRRVRSLLEAEIQAQDFGNVFTDPDLAEVLQIRQTFEEKNAFDEAIGVLH